MSLYTTLQKTKEELPDRLRQRQQEAEIKRQEQRIATAPAEPRNDTQGTGQTLMGKGVSGVQMSPASLFGVDPISQQRQRTQTQRAVAHALKADTPAAFANSQVKNSLPSTAVQQTQDVLNRYRQEAMRQQKERESRAQSLTLEDFHNDPATSAQYGGKYENYLNGQKDMSSAGLQAQIDDIDRQIEAAKQGGYGEELDLVTGSPIYANYDQIEQLKTQRGGLEAQLELAKTKEWEEQQKAQILAAGGEELLEKLREYDRFKKGTSETMTHADFAAMLSDLAAKGYSHEQFMEMADYAARLNSAEEYDAAIGKSKQAAAEHPVLASLGSVAGSLTSGFGMIDAADQNLRNLLSGKDTPVNYKTPLMIPSGATNAIRGQVASDIEEKTAGWAGSDTPLGNLYSDFYQLSMSMADSLGAVGLSAMGVPYAGALLGGSAATNAMMEAKGRGASDAQALTMGLIAGVAETVFEQYSIENLFSLKTPATKMDALMNILKQAFPEASEEFNTTIANTLADMFVMGDKSQYETEKRRYMAQGMTAQEAGKQASVDWVNGLMTDALGGFISGGMFGAGSNAVNSFQRSGSNTQSFGTGAAVNTDQAETPIDRVMLDTFQQLQGQTQTDGASGQSEPDSTMRAADSRPYWEDTRAGAAEAPRNDMRGLEADAAGGRPMASPTVEQAEAQGVELPETAVGAMKSDPQSFSYFQNQTDQFYPEGPNAARAVDMPMTGPTGRPVRRFANNAYGAQIMTDESVTGLEQDFMAGKLEYDVVTDQAALERAQNTVAQAGYDRAFAQTVERLQSIKDMKNTSATAQVLINQAIQAGRQEDAGVLLTLMASTGTELGQGLQSYSMFRKLTPEGQLAGIQSIADRIDQQVSERQGGASAETKQQTLKAVDDVRETALRLLQNIQQTFGEAYQKNHGVPVEDWITEIGNQLAKTLDRRSSAKTATTAQTIKNDLLRFAKGWVHQDQSARTPRTAVDTLRDYFGNRDAYNEAWNQARNVLSEKYKSNPQMLDSLDEFLTATIDYNGGTDSSVMLKAITEEAIAQELKDKNIQVRSFFGDQAAIENQISDALIRKTGAEGTDAGLIRAAVQRYISEQVNASKSKTADVIDKDIRAMVGKIGEDISQIIRSSPGEKAEIASDIASLLTKQYGVSKENAASTASYIVQQFNEYVAEKSEAELRKRFGEKKKKLLKSFEQNFTELANMGAFTGSSYQSAVTEKLFGHAVAIDQGLMQEFLNASDQDARNEVMTKIYKDIAAQVPATLADKWNAWRYLSMLGNPKTHVRNLGGNAGFMLARGAKNQMGAVMETVAEKAGWIDKSQRTKSLGFNWSQERRALRKAAKADYANVEDLILSGGKYNSATNTIEQNRRIFKNSALEALRKGNSYLLDLEDSLFSKSAYASSLAGYLKAQGFTAEDFTGTGMTDSQKDKARSYAIKEAQKATYRDFNTFSDMVFSIGFRNPGDNLFKKAANTAIESIMPFKRTPANILGRGMEYSPAGLAKALTVDIAQVANGKLTAAEYMDHLASGLTGTGLFALGALLRSMGIITGSTPDDEEQAELEGWQPNSLKIGKNYISLEWLAPEALSFFMGVELYDSLERNSGYVTMDSLKSFFNGLTGPVLEMSMMSSLQDALEATTYADNKIMAFLSNAALGYVGQAFPTLFGQMERTISGQIRDTTFTQKTGFLDTDTQYALGSLGNKIPFWDFSQVPYIDAWGRTEDTGNAGTRAFNNLLNPAYVSSLNETPVDQEIKRLEQATGENLTPSRAEKKLSMDGETVLLTVDEYVTYATAKGQNDYTLRENLINSEAYQGLDDAAKIKSMEYAKSYADELARQEAGIQDVQTAWMQELKEADAETVTQTLVAKAVESVLPATSAGKYTALAEMVENDKIEDAMALSLCSESLQEAYYDGPSAAGITVQQWIDTYGYAVSHAEDNSTESKRAAVVEYANSLDISTEQRTALVNGMYSAMPDIILKDAEAPNDFLLEQGQAGIETIEANMSDSQKGYYETYIKGQNVDMETYLDVWEFKGSARSDYDKDGKTTKSAQEKVIEYIDKVGRTTQEKRKLFLAMGYSEKNLPDQWK